MSELISYLALIAFYFLYINIVLKYILHMFQQNRYEVGRLFKWATKRLSSFIPMTLSTIVGLVIAYFTVHTWGALSASMCVMWYYVIVLILIIIKDSRRHSIKPLVYTWRVRRQLIILNLLNAICFFGLTYSLQYYWIYLMVVAWPMQWLFMVLTAWISAPIEAYVRNSFKKKAKLKLHEINPFVIGITGSFGKTSAKTILQGVISSQYISLMTPGSFNTPMGITRTIREMMKPIHEVFICEMGADHVGDIKELMKFVTPKYGLVTSIGEQHLNTFKSLDNIIREKMLEIEMLPSDGVGFLNIDNEHIRNYHLKNKCKTVTFAIDYPADYQAINITYSPFGSSFEIVNQGYAYPFSTRLLGKNNVSNVLAACAVAREMGISWDNIIRAVRKLNAVEHRLEKKVINGYTFIDNAFNSNPVGAQTSLEVLQSMPGNRILVTPGFIDLGKKQDYYNHRFGLQMMNHCDVVILVGRHQTEKIYQGLQEAGFNMDYVIVVDHVKQAFNYIYSHFTVNDTILLENDLPDAFSY